ncbi:ABC transporter permease [Plantactinospora siamensis]|uniref:ABC transporter permease n=1 Tax=Plantactinospora siamensis TaxID=555372 RepID=A0ABV6NXC1_9ACTN
MSLVRSELLKIRTTNTWWLFGLGAFVMLVLAFAFNAISAHFTLQAAREIPPNATPEQAEQIRAQADSLFQAANLFTSGQFFGLLFVMLLGILVVTNEFYHQTATTTFLATPHRTAVVLAKLVTAALFGVVVWLVTTVLSIPAGVIFLRSQGVADHLGEWGTTRPILLNLLAYVLWGILGVGLGVLIRSQIGATVTAALAYVLGTFAAGIIFTLLAQKWEWTGKLQVIVPSIASQLMISGTDLPGNPPQWVGALVLIGYAVVTGVIGTLLMRTRDIS